MITQKIPAEIIAEVEQDVAGLSFGTVTLQIVIHDNIPRFKIIREKSIIPDKAASGSIPGDRGGNRE
jgi:hypothetical protein